MKQTFSLTIFMIAVLSANIAISSSKSQLKTESTTELKTLTNTALQQATLLELQAEWKNMFNKERGSTCRDRKSTRLNSSHVSQSRMPSSA